MQMMLNSDIDDVIYSSNLAKNITEAPILITGGTGFIGSWIVKVLDRMITYKLIKNRIMILTSDKINAEESLNKLQVKNVSTYTLKELENLIINGSIGGFGYVFHCATSTKYAPNDKRNNFDKSLDLTRKILDLLQETDTVPNFINLSSGAVYGAAPYGSNFLEINEPIGINSSLTLYGELKVKIENLIVGADADGIIIGSNPRLFTFYGYGLPLNSHFAIGNFFNGAINKGFIEVTGSLQTVRSYLYITDLIVQLFSVATKPTLKTLHVGSSSKITIGDLALKISSYFNGCPIVFNNSESDPNYYIPEVSHSINYLDCRPEIPLDTGLTRWKKSLEK